MGTILLLVWLVGTGLVYFNVFESEYFPERGFYLAVSLLWPIAAIILIPLILYGYLRHRFRHGD